MNIEQWLKDNPGWHRPKITCKDGTHISVQQSDLHHCDDSTVEVMLYDDTRSPKGWADYKDGGVYTWVPYRLVDTYIAKHGGMK